MTQDGLEVDAYSVMSSFYDAWAAHMEDDVGFYVARAREATGPVVELGAGTGRVTIPIALAGRQVIAVDASRAMLTRGTRAADAAGVASMVRFECADMRSFVADPPTDLVIIPFRSFLHLTTTGDQLAALDAIRASLSPGGRLILNIFQPDPFVMARQDGMRNPHGSFVDERGRRCEMWAEPRYDVAEQLLELRAGMDVYDGERIVDSVDTLLHLRVMFRFEMEHLLARAGFEVDALLGSFDGRPFTHESSEMIWIARRP